MCSLQPVCFGFQDNFFQLFSLGIIFLIFSCVFNQYIIWSFSNGYNQHLRKEKSSASCA